jgi:hypothetical protein
MSKLVSYSFWGVLYITKVLKKVIYQNFTVKK